MILSHVSTYPTYFWQTQKEPLSVSIERHESTLDAENFSQKSPAF